MLEQGHGTKKPTPRSIVYVHYTGRLIDGTVFDTTEGQPLPALFMVGDLIMGWQIALTRMHEGDKWEVYIPAKWGYGALKMDDIPKFIETLKNFGDTISSTAENVFDEVDKTFDGLDTSKLTPEQEKEIEKKLEEKD